MSKELNLDIISEGVETKEQADFLHSLGCNIMQGYYYAEPMSAHDFIELLKKDETLGD
jgi:EAL domain-containing protein (putative c-di-GMP-specific phosphodiesterase class I)